MVEVCVTATLKDVADLAGVSTATVSRVLTGTVYVSEETRQNVLKCVQELNYKPNALARSLRRSRSQTIGILVPDISNPYFMTIIKAIEERMLPHGFHILVASSNEDWGREKTLFQIFVEKRVDGIVLASANREPSSEVSECIVEGLPMVAVDRLLDGAGIDMVVEENLLSSSRLVGHLMQMGHEEIALISSVPSVSTAYQRIQGYERAHADRGLQVDPSRVYLGDFSHESGYELGRQFLMERTAATTAVFCGNNFVAAGFLMAAREVGVSIPDDISVVSFGRLPLSELIMPHLTSLVQCPEEIGEHAADRLLARIVNQIRVPPCIEVMPIRMEYGNSVWPGPGYAYRQLVDVR